MTAHEYQMWSGSTSRYPESYIDWTDRIDDNETHHVETFPFYLCLGLAGETGEVLEIFKKFWRRQETHLNQEEKDQLKLELGDVLWYWTQICSQVGFTIEEVMDANKQKLIERRKQHG